MSIPTVAPVTLQHRYAAELPELVQPWQAEAAPQPRLVLLNEPLAAELGLDPDWLRSSEGLGFLVGTHVPEGATPVAQVYAGHQFGGYSPRLGDGRALLLGELETAHGTRDVHLKGSGRTPFARGGDGLAVLGPMLREYVISEAMHAFGIPTTRSLAVVATGRMVRREATALPGAVLARVASSHLRVGTFQYARALDDPALLRRLADHAIARHHPAAKAAASPYLALFEAVRDAQARLVAQWMGVGFVHGVMNTDNVTISGESIDFGPCAFLDAADPATVFSSIDQGGRYAFGNQPAVTGWNLARFAEALLPLLHDEEEQAIEIATASLQGFGPSYAAAWTSVVRRKLGLAEEAAGGPGDAVVAELGEEVVRLLQANPPADHTGFWRALAAAARGDVAPARDLLLDVTGFDGWAVRWLALGPDAELMEDTNPVHVPRNHLVEESLEAATGGDLAPVRELLDAVTQPFALGEVDERYRQPAPEGAGAYTTYCGT